MASLTQEQALAALQNAHKAGDTTSAKRMAEYIQVNFGGLQPTGGTPAPQPTQTQAPLDQSKVNRDRAFYRSQNPDLSEEEFNKRWAEVETGRAQKMGVLGGLTSAAVEGTQSRGLGLLSGAASAVDRGIEGVTRITGGETNPDGTLFGRAGEYLSEKSEELRPKNLTQWEQVKKDPSIGNILQFGAEQGLVSIPDMGAALASLPAYVGARFGELLEERLENSGKDVPDAEDYAAAAATAGVSAALERVGAKAIFAPASKTAAGRVASGVVKEGATEFGQEFVEDAGTTTGTKVGFNLDRALDRGLAGAVGGGVAGGGFTTIGELTSAYEAEKTSEKVNDNITDDDRRLAQRLIEAADGDQSLFLEMDESKNDSARSVANAVMLSLRAEKNQLVSDLKKLAGNQQDPEAAKASLDQLHRVTRNQTARVPESYINQVRDQFQGTADVDRLVSISHQLRKVEDFVRPGGTRGGLSKFTRRFDITDANNHINRGMLGIGAIFAPQAIAAGVAANRSAVVLDKLTNRRSRVKRFVDEASGSAPGEISGPSAKDLIKKSQEAATQAQNRARLKQTAARFGPWSNVKAPGGTDISYQPPARPQDTRATKRLAEEARKLADQRAEIEATRAAVEQMFETNEIPASDYYEPYQLWEKFTGLGPVDTLKALQALAQQPGSPVTPEDVENFRYNIHAMGGSPRTYALQELVRQSANPEHQQQKVDEEARQQQTIQFALNRSKGGRGQASGSTNRRAEKSREGANRYRKVLDTIDNDPNLSPTQAAALYALADGINSPEFTKDDRSEIVDEAIAEIFGESPSDQAKAALWKLRFSPLVTIANNYRIERDGEAPTETEQKADETFKERVRKVRSAESSPQAAEVAPGETATPEPAQSLPEAPSKEVDFVEEKAKAKDPKIEPVKEPKAKTEKAQKLIDKAGKVDTKKGNRTSLAERMADAFRSFFVSEDIRSDYKEDLESHIRILTRQGTPEAQVELMMLSSPGRNTQNQLTEQYADLAEVDIAIAAEVVNNALLSMEQSGKVVRSLPSGNTALKRDGSLVKTTDGKAVVVVNVDPVADSQFAQHMEIAKAVDKVERLPQVGSAHFPFSRYFLSQGRFRALKDIPATKVTDAHMPLVDFLNALRSLPVKVDNRIISVIEDAVLNADERRLGELSSQLEKKLENGKDASNLMAAAQLLYQMETNGRSPLVHQEWFAGRNGRVYAQNGSATSQGGDLMKGLFRAPVSVPPGDAKALDFMFHSFGNILGFDKDAPVKRRGAVFEGDTIEQLLKFAEDPFKRDLLTSRRKGEPTRLGKLVNGSEGFFQALSVALELKAMVDFAQARHPQFKDPKQLLLDPAVREDLAKNYKTDMFVQLDANNNSFQLVGLMTGDQAMLEATGLQPPAGDQTPADERQPADVYMAPAVAVAQRVPELTHLLGLSDGKKRLRKLFKRPISTYVYASTSQSRNEAFMHELYDQAASSGFITGKGKDRKVRVFGLEGGQEGYINVPAHIHQPLAAGEPVTFLKPQYDSDGDVVKVSEVKRRLVEVEGGWAIETSKGSGKSSKGKMVFPSKEEAIIEAFERDFKARLNRELVREIETRFPKVREFMNFTSTVEKIMRGRGSKTIKVTPPDGIPLEYRFKDSEIYAPFEANLGDKVVKRLGLKTEDGGTKGRGLAAFIAHSHDAFVLREAFRQLNGEGGLSGFNPIHDSFGFHPSDAARGQDKVLEIMQALGNQNYNIFESILKDNNISLEEFQDAASSPMIERQGINPVPSSEIPTAVS